jgi:2-phosphosulfolactate phosphatase
LDGRLSPEAEVAVAAFQNLQGNLVTALERCSSGKELVARGFAKDVELAAAINISSCVPLLVNKAYVKQEATRFVIA